MKKIIDGKVYDTDKAAEVGCYWNNNDTRAFNHVTETLYRKRTGEYFLHGEGGPLTEYCRWIGANERTGGETIRPMTPEEARRWAEEKLEADEYQKEFGEISEDDTRTVLSITMAASLAERLRREAAKAGMSLSAYIESRLS